MTQSRIFTMGDIHGEYEKLIACLKTVNFDYQNDTLIQLGDVVDRGKNSYLVIEELLKIKNLIAIRGNHDDCFLNSLKTGEQNVLWNQGGKETHDSYINQGLTPDYHIDFFEKQLPYYIDKDNNCFVHGGFNRHHLISQQNHITDLWWDRDLLHSARSHATSDRQVHFKNKNNFPLIFIGHTPTQYFGFDEPQLWCNIWDIDTGCGKGGLLTIMNVETKEFKQA